MYSTRIFFPLLYYRYICGGFIMSGLLLLFRSLFIFVCLSLPVLPTKFNIITSWNQDTKVLFFVQFSVCFPPSGNNDTTEYEACIWPFLLMTREWKNNGRVVWVAVARIICSVPPFSDVGASAVTPRYLMEIGRFFCSPPFQLVLSFRVCKVSHLKMIFTTRTFKFWIGLFFEIWFYTHPYYVLTKNVSYVSVFHMHE